MHTSVVVKMGLCCVNFDTPLLATGIVSYAGMMHRCGHDSSYTVCILVGFYFEFFDGLRAKDGS